MQRLRTVAAAIVSIVVLFFDFVSAWYGEVTFYHDIYFDNVKYPWGINISQKCFNLSCFNDKASSIKWEGLPNTGSFDGKSRIAFYTGRDCTGTSRDWPTDAYTNNVKNNYPEDLSLDGINDDISSFMVWETSKNIVNGIMTPCPWGTN
ncbi:hypothetical protein BBJ28_00003465 [Nothophytophthora sp. Chile5]|nr:hypothetical protein BBJ28_00003465 [Nothophytophthora sp. Chile5]